MLQPAVAVVHRVEHEQVVFVGRLLRAVPEADLRLADLLRVGQQAGAVEAGGGAGDHKAVRHAAGAEAAAPERRPFRPGSRPARRSRRPGSCRNPACRFSAGPGRWPPTSRSWRAEATISSRCGASVLALDAQAQAAAVEEAAPGVQPGGAHRVVVGIHLVDQLQRLVRHCSGSASCICRAAATAPPAAPAPPAGRAAPAGSWRTRAPGSCPGIHTGRLSRCSACGPGDGQRDAKQVGVDVGDLDTVVDAE